MKNRVLIVNFVLLVLTICQSCSSYNATTSLADVDTINIDKSLHDLLQTSYIPYFIEHVIKKEKLKVGLEHYASLMRLKANSNPVLFYLEYK